MKRALTRYGAVLVAPRATAAALGPQEGRHDGIWLGLAYVAGSQIAVVARALKGLTITGNFTGALKVLASLATALLPIIITLVVVELALGPQRSYRRGICLVPLVILGSVAHLMAQFHVGFPGPSYMPVVLGGLWSVGLAAWMRSAVPPEPKEGEASA